MHDLLTAQDILKTALRYAKRNKLKSVTKIVIGLGSISAHGETITSDSLKFNINVLSKNTTAKDAKIIIEEVDGDAWKLKSIEGIK